MRVLLCLLVACGSVATGNPDASVDVPVAVDGAVTDPGVTWGSALMYWSVAFCQYANRCAPSFVRSNFGDRVGCAARTQWLNCHSSPIDCDAPFPRERDEFVLACLSAEANKGCNRYDDPYDCVVAFKVNP